MNSTYFFHALIKNIKRPTTAGVITGLFVHWAIVFLAYLWYNALVNQKEIELVHEMEIVKNHIEERFNTSVASLASLSLAVGHDGTVHEFESVAQAIKSEDADINTLAILPHGIYQYFYPETKEHQSIKGFDLMKNGDSWTKKRIEDAIKSKSAVFIGPFPSVANNSIIITVSPVFIRGQFWGLTMLTTKSSRFVEGLDKKIPKNLSVSISNINPLTGKEYFFYSLGEKPENKKTISYDEKFSRNNWRLYGIYPKPNLLWLLSLPIILSLIVAFVMGAYVNSLIHTPKELRGRVRAQKKNWKIMIFVLKVFMITLR